jgi:hypothetical protein
MSKYRAELLMNTFVRFTPMLQRVGREGRPRALTQMQGQALSAKLFLHWFFMDRCAPASAQAASSFSSSSSSSSAHSSSSALSAALYRDVLSPGQATTLAYKIMVGSKTVRNNAEDGKGYGSSKMWTEEPPEVAAKNTGRPPATGPTWQCRKCKAPGNSYHSTACFHCANARAPNQVVHPVWTAARAVTEEWRKHFAHIHDEKLLAKPACRYLPSSSPNWSDAITKVTAELEANSDADGLDGRMRLKLNGVNIFSVKIRKPVYDRLCATYKSRGHDPSKLQTRLLNMAVRYHCIMGESGQHGQLPREVFKFLHDQLQVF